MTDLPLSRLFGTEAISADTRAVNARLASSMAARPAPTSLAEAREAFANGRAGIPASPRSPHAGTLAISGPGGAIGLRVLVPNVVRGAYLHIHGGGWVTGTNDMWDDRLERLGRDAGLACVSVDYRLAPEHVFPAAVDDCVASALWLIDRAETEFGTGQLAIGGESAGAHLSVLTLIRLREMGHTGAFRAANLLYGCYDLSLTPSTRRAKETPVLDRSAMEGFVAAFRGDAEARDPAISPLYADLTGLPPALFSVGTLDPLADDTLFMHRGWQTAGNEAELAVYPGGVHGFDTLDGELSDAAHLRCGSFLRQRLA